MIYVRVAVQEFIGRGKWIWLEEFNDVLLSEVGLKAQELANKYKTGDNDYRRIIIE